MDNLIKDHLETESLKQLDYCRETETMKRLLRADVLKVSNRVVGRFS